MKKKYRKIYIMILLITIFWDSISVYAYTGSNESFYTGNDISTNNIVLFGMDTSNYLAEMSAPQDFSIMDTVSGNNIVHTLSDTTNSDISELTLNIDTISETSNGNKIYSKSNGDLTFNIEYPANLMCGTPTFFHFSATGGSGNYKYRIHSLLDDLGNSVYDVSYGHNSDYNTKDNWEFTFYASGKYYIRFSMIDMATYETVTSDLNGICLNISDSAYPSVTDLVSIITEQCLEEGCVTDYEKALWLNDWLVANSTYDYSYSYCSAESTLARGTGTCEGYHQAYVMLLNKLGIPTGRITGNGHVWTAVKLGGKWCQVDTTWNDAGYTDSEIDLQRLYFGLNDQIISLVHSDHTAVSGYESQTLENNYFIKSGEISKWSNPLIPEIQKYLNQKEITFEITISDFRYSSVIYSLVAYDLANKVWETTDGTAEINVSYIPSDNLNGILKFEVKYKPMNNFIEGWKQDGKGYWYQNEDGSYPINSWKLINGKWYHFDHNGYRQTGWFQDGKIWYFLEFDGKMATNKWIGEYYLKSNGAMAVNEWVDSNQYYVDSNGKRVSGKCYYGWKQNNTGYWYQNIDGTYPANCWKLIENEWYHFDTNGYRQTGWIKDGYFWYYLASDGKMVTNKWIGEYYLKSSGAMAANEWVENYRYFVDASGKKIYPGWKQDNTGYWYQNVDGSKPVNCWKLIGDSWYHFDNNGYRQTGWLKDGNLWYYLESNGKMATNKWIGNYYVKASGSMAVNEWVDNNQYYVNESGIKISSGWKQNSTGYWYQNKDGTYPVNCWKLINNNWYYFDNNGYRQTGWLKVDNLWYFFETDGKMATNKWIGNYYLKSSGAMAINEWVDNDRYYVNEAGLRIKTR